MKHKHAFLIMAHNNWYVLEKLLLLLDAPFVDIYIHIDKKVKDFNKDRFSKLCQKTRIFYIKLHNVSWGNETQIKAEMDLFKAAYKNGPYWYYHFLSGTDLILKPIDEIYKFFDQTQENFLQVLPADKFMWRLKNYINIFRQRWMPVVCRKKLNICSEVIQHKLNTNRLKWLSIKYPIWAKGHNWCDLTEDAVRALIESSHDIRKFTRFTHCPDEMYKQIILLNNSGLKDTIAKYDIRRIDWGEGESHPKIFQSTDFDSLISSKHKIFARKFEDIKSRDCVDLIFNYLTNGRK